jgi:SAM-dependent methyltransferase
MNNTCRICDTGNNTEEYELNEMMFGLNERFAYFKCSNCGCLQIKDFPDNMEKYYPPEYLNYPPVKRSLLKEYLMNSRENAVLSGKGIFGKLLKTVFGFTDPNLLWALEAKINIDDSILEVGPGKGELLLKLKRAGFKNLLGVDAFIEKDIIYDDNCKIIKMDFSQLDNLKFDWIMLHHSFEHLKDPVQTFEKLNSLLNPNGNVLIRIPVIDSYAWEKYKTNWIQLDPPRHFFLHSKKSIEYLSSRFNFKIYKIFYDSTAFQFIGSDQYIKHIPLISSKSYYVNPNDSIFTNDIINNYSNKAKELNTNKLGDTACYFLKKEK